MTIRVCIVVPVFNHGKGAAETAKKLEPFGLRTYLVDDGSDAQTADVLDDLANRYDWVHLLRHPVNQGKGVAVLSGLRAARDAGFSHALQIDADGQHNPGDIPEFLAMAKDHPNAVITGRPIFDDTIPKARLIARYITHVWVWIETLSFDIKDSLCGFRIYPLTPVSDLAERVRLGRRMDFDTEILVRLYWEGLSILSIPTRVIYPEGGKSHFRLWQDNLLISWMHTKLVCGLLWRVLLLRYRRRK